jgi:hypothetical protein
MAAGGRGCLSAALALLVGILVWRSNVGGASAITTVHYASAANTAVLASRRPAALLVESGGSSTPHPLGTSHASAIAALEPAAITSEPVPPVSEPQLVQEPLPQCSVLFFHHLEKTGGTTLRSILQRHAQLGEFDFISFVNRFDKLQFQMVLHRLHTLLDQPDGLRNLRLAVEIHIGGHLNHPYFNMYTLPDLLMLRAALRARGCKCNLVTLLRHPLLHHLSWHYHFCNHRVPLCFWRNPPDCQARLAMGLTCHDGPHLAPLTAEHEAAVQLMWDSFDLVGVTELFDEFTIRLTDMVGLQRPAYRQQIVASHTLSRQHAQRNWTALTCAQLLSRPPPDLMGLISARMEGSAKNALGHRLRNGGSSTGGPRGHMECRGYGPCLVPGVSEREQSVDMLYDADKCAASTPIEVLRRACGNMDRDERLYRAARKRFEAATVAAERAPGHTARRVQLLREEGVRLAERANAQRSTPTRTLEERAGIRLARRYEASSGGGVPWVVDELGGWYLAHERARYSCERCSGDVVPEKDLIGCWPLWTQFAPDEMAFKCNRTWSADPGLHEPRRYQRATAGTAPIPCWQTCWTPMGERRGLPTHAAAAAVAGAGPASEANAHCTAPCPAAAKPAWQWRQVWEAQLAAFLSREEVGRKWRAAMAFVRPHAMDDFIYNVY